MKKIYLSLAVVTAISLSSVFGQSSGRVGIGTSAPKTKLDVAGAISTSEQAAPANANLTISQNVSLFRITAVGGNQANNISLSSPAEGQLLIIINEDDNDATFAGSTVKADGGSNSYVYANSSWRMTGTSQTNTGPKGPSGAKGDKGDKGDDGAAGPQGPKGDTGAAGANGAQGPQGVKGDTGPQGAQGPKGDTGAAGANGAQGPQGVKGDTGPQGAQGPKGDTGASGSVTAPIGCSSVTTSTITEDFESGDNGWSFTAGTGAVRIGTAYSNCSSAGSCITGNSRNGSNALQFQLCANNCDNCVYAEKSFDFGPTGGSFSFWRKVGTQSGNDYLRVFVDGVQQSEFSNCSNTWTQTTVNGVAPGIHTIRFALRTNSSTISNGGRAQIDDLVITRSNISPCVNTPQKIIRGTVNADGTVASGGGFIITSDGEGRYRITFVTPFSDIPSASVTLGRTYNGSSGVGSLSATDSYKTTENAIIYGISADGINIATGEDDGDRKDRSFSFIVIGSE